MAAVSANKLELLQIADAVAREKSIDRSIVIAAMEDAIAKAARARYGSETDVHAEIDAKKGELRLSRHMRVYRRLRFIHMRGSLEQMMSQLKTTGRKDFPLIIKADVQGSLEAILGSLDKLGTDEVAARILHAGVGGISESDVTLAEGFNAAIIGFSVRANKEAAAAAKRNGIEIRYYNIIYDLVDDIKKAMSGLLAPTLRETMLGAVMFGHRHFQPVVKAIIELAEKAAKEPREVAHVDDTALEKEILGLIEGELRPAYAIADKQQRQNAVAAAKAKVMAHYFPEGQEPKYDKLRIAGVFKHLEAKIVRWNILDTGKRIDGRDSKTVRNIIAEVGVLPRAHGSALFTRGETQAMVVTTLGTGEDEQYIDSLSGTYKEQFLLHYKIGRAHV